MYWWTIFLYTCHVDCWKIVAYRSNSNHYWRLLFALHVELSVTVTQVRIASLFTVQPIFCTNFKKYLAPFNLKIECTKRYIFSSKLQNESGCFLSYRDLLTELNGYCLAVFSEIKFQSIKNGIALSLNLKKKSAFRIPDSVFYSLVTATSEISMNPRYETQIRKSKGNHIWGL